MTAWRRATLGDVATLSNGANFTKDAFGTGLRIIGVRDFGDRLYPDWSGTDEIQRSAVSSDATLLQEGDLLFVRSNGNRSLVGRCLLITPGPEATHSAFTIRARPDRSQVLPRFLAYQMRHAHRVGQMLAASGTNITNLNQPTLRSVPVLLPTMSEQKSVVSVLAAIDDLIENNRRRVEVLEGMTRAIYREWFVHFRYPGHEDVPFVDPPLSPIPDGWALLSIGDVLKLRYGKALKKHNRRGGPVAVVSSAGVVGWHDEALVQGPTIVVGRKGNVGSVTWVDGDCWPIDTAYFVESGLPLRYVVEQLRATEFLNTHAAVPGLSRDQAYSRPFLRPTSRLMENFDAVADALADEASTLTAASQRLADVRDLLLPRLVTGKIDISNVDLDALTELVTA